MSVSCICLHSNDEILKGRASAAYERAMSDLENMTDATWHSLLQDVLVRYVTLLTNPEGPAVSVPTLTRQEIIQHDNGRKQACAAAAAAAAAANDGGGEGEAAQPAAAKTFGGARKTKQPAAAAAEVQEKRGSRTQPKR